MKSKITVVSVREEPVVFPVLARIKENDLLKENMRFTVLFSSEKVGMVVQADEGARLSVGEYCNHFSSVLNSSSWELLSPDCKIILSNQISLGDQMDRKNIKVRLTSEKDIREAYAALVALGYLAQNNADFYVQQKAIWFYGEKNRYPSFQAGDYCIEWDDDLAYGLVQPHEEVTVYKLRQLSGVPEMGSFVKKEAEEAKEDQSSTIEISWVEYKDLQKAARKLQALENHGVDNWSGYCDAMCEANQDDDEDE